MKTVRPKPISLRPPSATHRRWFWMLMALAAVVIAVGWTMTIRSILADIPAVSSQIQTSIEQAAEQVEEAQLESPVDIDEAQEAWQALKEGYEAQKARQQEPYGQEDTTNPATP